MENSQLLNRIKELEKLCQQLINRVCELEDSQEYQNEQIKKLQQQIEQQQTKQNQIEESWLFYCEKNRPGEEIKEKLDVKSDYIFEFDYSKWTSKANMWQEIIQTFNKQKIDLKNYDLKQFSDTGLETLKQYYQEELLIILRNIPDQKNQHQFNCLIDLCEKITKCWNEMENDDQDDGRILLVLETKEQMNNLEMIDENQKIIIQIEKLE